MVSLRKIFAVAIFAAVFGFALYEKYVAIGLGDEVEAARQNLRRLTLAAHQARSGAAKATEPPGRSSPLPGNPSARGLIPGSDEAFEAEITSWLSDLGAVRRSLAGHPELNIPELQLLTEENWLDAAHPATSRSSRAEEGNATGDTKLALALLREYARRSFLSLVAEAVDKFRTEHERALPSNFEELRPFLPPTVDSAMLARYDATLVGHHFLCAEKIASSVDPDRLAVFDLDTGPGPQDSFITFQTALERVVHDASRRYAAAHDGARPTEPEQIRPFLTTPVDSSVLAEMFGAQAMPTSTP
ncbi:MAG: hypothetical protein ABIO94_01090 [Opitutaceae bacterium]